MLQLSTFHTHLLCKAPLKTHMHIIENIAGLYTRQKQSSSVDEGGRVRHW